MTQLLRTLKFSVQRDMSAPLRTALFEQREHIVVPVVMIREGVLHAVNAAAPEFVPASTLAVAPAGWDGRPVMGGHPVVNGEHVSANDPRILENHSFGKLFNTEMSGINLRSEAWLDPSHAQPGSIGERAIERVQAGEAIEVSVGAFIVLDNKPGVFQGKSFSASWKEIVPDHLAFLAEGDTGACSNEMGCGAPRAAQLHEGVEMADKKEDEIPKRSLRERLLDLMKFRGSAPASDATLRGSASAADMSDDDLRRALDASLRADEPGYLGVDSVFPGESNVVYATAPGEELQLFRRSYTLDADGTVALDKKKERVEPVTRFEPLTAAEEATPPEPVTKCGCEARAAEGEAMKTKAERIAALINDNKRGFTSAHQLFLESQSDEQLAALEAVAPVTEPAPAAEPVVASAAKPTTVDEYISQAPTEMREVLSEGLRAAKARREAVITTLKATNRCDYTDVELAAMSSIDLERLSKLAAAAAPQIDFTGRTVVRPTTTSDVVDEPPSLLGAIRAFQGNGKTVN